MRHRRTVSQGCSGSEADSSAITVYVENFGTTLRSIVTVHRVDATFPTGRAKPPGNEAGTTQLTVDSMGAKGTGSVAPTPQEGGWVMTGEGSGSGLGQESSATLQATQISSGVTQPSRGQQVRGMVSALLGRPPDGETTAGATTAISAIALRAGPRTRGRRRRRPSRRPRWSSRPRLPPVSPSSGYGGVRCGLRRSRHCQARAERDQRSGPPAAADSRQAPSERESPACRTRWLSLALALMIGVLSSILPPQPSQSSACHIPVILVPGHLADQPAVVALLATARGGSLMRMCWTGLEYGLRARSACPRPGRAGAGWPACPNTAGPT